MERVGHVRLAVDTVDEDLTDILETHAAVVAGFKRLLDAAQRRPRARGADEVVQIHP